MTFQPKIFRSKTWKSKSSGSKTSVPYFQTLFIQKYSVQNHENPKVLVSKPRSPIFKHFSAKNIPFKIASPKMGNFIDWNFTLTILGDANGYLLYYVVMPWFYVLVTILWCNMMYINKCNIFYGVGGFGFLYPVQINVHFGLCAWKFWNAKFKTSKNTVVSIMLLFCIFWCKNMWLIILKLVAWSLKDVKGVW